MFASSSRVDKSSIFAQGFKYTIIPVQYVQIRERRLGTRSNCTTVESTKNESSFPSYMKASHLHQYHFLKLLKNYLQGYSGYMYLKVDAYLMQDEKVFREDFGGAES